MAEMVIAGGMKNVLFDVLKSHSIREVLGVNKDMVLVQPALVGWQTSAPNSKRKYGVVTLKLGFIPDAFENKLKSVEALNPENLGLILYTCVKGEYLSEQAKKYSANADTYLDEVFARYPQLGELFNEFLQKWEAAYAEAIRKEDVNSEMGTERTED